ncbi:hypothetical protein [uncultured Draconibacterium sp.]|uniref:hypothetical protein n=1 Tax=uncultured Draconibacterium sp. TaxID=1573823 RepID=UPI003216C04E
MRLSDYKETYESHTSTLSNINRSIAFAGIAIVWIFKRTEVEVVVIDEKFLLPLLLFISGLCFDMLHYIYQSVAWYIVFRKKEREYQQLRNNSANPPDEFEHEYWITYPAWTFFAIKILCVIVGFIFLFIKLFDHIF